MVLLRRVIGDALRARRQAQHRTLREVSTAANVSLGYLSEVERGQKEPSSELLSAICEALGAQLSELLRDVSSTVEHAERGTAGRGALVGAGARSASGDSGTTSAPGERGAAGGNGAGAVVPSEDVVPPEDAVPARREAPSRPTPVPAGAAARLAAPGRAARTAPVAKATAARPVLTTTVDGDVAVTVRQNGPLRTTLRATRTGNRPTDRGHDTLLPV
jgi:hypothetical protein